MRILALQSANREILFKGFHKFQMNSISVKAKSDKEKEELR